MNKLYASDLLSQEIERMVDRIDRTEDKRNRTVRNYIATLPTLEALEVMAYDNEIEISRNATSNLGTIIEAVVKSVLNKGDSLAPQGVTDLVTGGKRFDIKLLIKGSTSYPSEIALDTKDDVLFVTDSGVYILRNKDIMKAKQAGYMNSKNRFTGKVLTSDLLVTTAFTERLTLELGLGRNA